MTQEISDLQAMLKDLGTVLTLARDTTNAQVVEPLRALRVALEEAAEVLRSVRVITVPASLLALATTPSVTADATEATPMATPITGANDATTETAS